MNDLDFNENPELNITPLVDIMLVLLAILMVTAPTLTYMEQVSLPEGSKKIAVNAKKEALLIEVNAQKKLSIAGTVVKLSEFPDNLALVERNFDKTKPTFIRADKSLKYGEVMFVLKTLKTNGFSKISLETI